MLLPCETRKSSNNIKNKIDQIGFFIIITYIPNILIIKKNIIYILFIEIKLSFIIIILFISNSNVI